MTHALAEVVANREFFLSPTNRIWTPLVRLQNAQGGGDPYPYFSYWQPGFYWKLNNAQALPPKLEPQGMLSGTQITRTASIRIHTLPLSTEAAPLRVWGKGAQKTWDPGGLDLVLPGARRLAAMVCASNPSVETVWRLYAEDQYGIPFSEVKVVRGRTHEYPRGYTATNWSPGASTQEPGPHGVGTGLPVAPVWPPSPQVPFVSWWNSHWANLSPRPVVADEIGQGAPFYNPNGATIRTANADLQDAQWNCLPLAEAFQFQRPISRFIFAELLSRSNTSTDDLMVFCFNTVDFGLRGRIESPEDVVGGYVKFVPVTNIVNLDLLGGVQGAYVWCLSPLEAALKRRYMKVKPYNVLSFTGDEPTPVSDEEGTFKNAHVFAGLGSEAVSYHGELMLAWQNWELCVETQYHRR